MHRLYKKCNDLRPQKHFFFGNKDNTDEKSLAITSKNRFIAKKLRTTRHKTKASKRHGMP